MMKRQNQISYDIILIFLFLTCIYVQQKRKKLMSNNQKLHGNVPTQQEYLSTIQINLPSNNTFKQKFDIDPPRELAQKHYSLDADMINGWKPRNFNKNSSNVIFPINYANDLVDQIKLNLLSSRKKDKCYLHKIVYIGKRPSNSYLLHEGKSYLNPYPPQKKREAYLLGKHRNNYDKIINIDNNISFNSDFQSGNLDLAVKVSQHQYDLFMRIDSNTRGHTNWFYFKVFNKDYIGPLKLNICNFTRPKSLYQRGLKPYGQSKFQNMGWKQVGENISYTKKKLAYEFFKAQQQQERFNKYFTLSFTYDFKISNDTTSFAYCIPYTYSNLNIFLSKLPNCKKSQLTKSLAGLNVPLLQITDQTSQQYNKQVILLTARTHPGQSNSSYIMEGFLKFICSNDLIAIELRKKSYFFVIPMLNPDGVVAGNFRTSCFGKDLNRTFDQNRQYAFPQTYFLLQLVKKLKKVYTNNFLIYLDFHGHSIKKNAFTYGPGFQVSNTNYFLCREFPQILSKLTSIFRYYSCQFNILPQKSSTSRAVLNRKFHVPFTYTLQSSTSSYYDLILRKQQQFNQVKWITFGYQVVKALHQFLLVQKRYNSIKRIKKDDQERKPYYDQAQQIQQQCDQIDKIQQDKSDEELQDQDLPDELLKNLQMHLEGTKKLQMIEEQPKKYLSRCKTQKQYSPTTALKSSSLISSSLSHRKINFQHIFRKHDYKTCSHRRCRLRYQEQQKKLSIIPQNSTHILPSIYLKNKQPFFLKVENKKNTKGEIKQFKSSIEKSRSNQLSVNRMVLKQRSQMFSLDQRTMAFLKRNKYQQELNKIQITNRC